MAVVSMKSLLEAGVHFGHQTRRWNPKMARYIFTERNGIYIIDLQKTVKKVEEAYSFLRETAAAGETILFFGTKKQAQEAIKEEANLANIISKYFLKKKLSVFVMKWKNLKSTSVASKICLKCQVQS